MKQAQTWEPTGWDVTVVALILIVAIVTLVVVTVVYEMLKGQELHQKCRDACLGRGYSEYRVTNTGKCLCIEEFDPEEE